MSPKLFVKGGEGQKQSWVCGQNIVANYDDYNAEKAAKKDLGNWE